MSRLTDAFLPFMQLRRELSQLLDGYEGNGGAAPRGFPPVNIWDDGERFYAEAELPGVQQADVEVFTIGDELTLRGKRSPQESTDVTYHRRERGAGEFERVIALPAQLDAERVEARLHNGVLTVSIPKAEAAKPRKITVQAG